MPARWTAHGPRARALGASVTLLCWLGSAVAATVDHVVGAGLFSGTNTQAVDCGLTLTPNDLCYERADVRWFWVLALAALGLISLTTTFLLRRPTGASPWTVVGVVVAILAALAIAETAIVVHANGYVSAHFD